MIGWPGKGSRRWWDEAQPPAGGPRLAQLPRQPLPQSGAEHRQLRPGGGGQLGRQVQGRARPLLCHIPYRQDPAGEEGGCQSQEKRIYWNDENDLYNDGCGDWGIFVNKIPSPILQYYFISLQILNKLKAEKGKEHNWCDLCQIILKGGETKLILSIYNFIIYNPNPIASNDYSNWPVPTNS